MRKRRVRPTVVHDKAWHDAQMELGFWDRAGKEYVSWQVVQDVCVSWYDKVGFDDLPSVFKPRQWYHNDPDTQPLKRKR